MAKMIPPYSLMNRRAAGAKSKRAGDQWENHVSTQWLEPLKQEGVILCWHKLEPRKVGAIFLAAAGADFVVCLASGEYVAIECKHTKERRFSRREISAVQASHLDSVPRSFLALLLDGKAFMIPWRSVPWVRLRTADSISAEECARWEVGDSRWLRMTFFLSLFCGQVK